MFASVSCQQDALHKLPCDVPEVAADHLSLGRQEASVMKLCRVSARTTLSRILLHVLHLPRHPTFSISI